MVVSWSPDDFGRTAIEHAVSEARLRSASLVVVNATRGDSLVDDHYARGSQVEDLRRVLTETAVPFEIRQSMGSDIADQVLDVAEEVAATLIVVAVHRRSPVGKLIMGSVAQRVILGADCPVIAVKP
ncbi:universal stress protein [Nocardioides cavernaquae]|uniref:Universal stress protein n=1 Tax=Nocardioides cavernaquae TaxID=2321396 RepID=A0A3A5HC58_9ACTN|nr:universal stress protein [Nocardioides cavernaquae]